MGSYNKSRNPNGNGTVYFSKKENRWRAEIHWTDKNGKQCDLDASYVLVTKYDEEYVMKMVNNVIRNFPANNKLLSKINLRRLSGS